MKKKLFRIHFWCCLILTATAFDLFAQKWDTLAPIPESFTFPVVAVAEGKIHIMGGGGANGATSHHFAYDPATNTWESKAQTPYLAQQPAGAALNGRIHYFGGGYPNSGTPLNAHYAYDPDTDTWSQAANLTAPRAIHYGVELDDVLYSLAGQGMANLCQTYTDSTNAWTTKNTLPDNGFWYGAHVATEGHIYRFCGGGYTAPNKLAHRYNPSNDTWIALPAFPVATHGLSGAAIGNEIYLAGGYHDFEERAEVWVYHTQTQTYTAGVPLPLGRNYHNMVALDSCIYVLGGNHAIDETVKFQLLRFCPFEMPSATTEKTVPELKAGYVDGNLILKMPGGFQEKIQLSIFDMSGKPVWEEKAISGSGDTYEVWVGNLSPAVYAVRLTAKGGVFTDQFIVH